jgi:cell division protein FtsQ
MDEQPFESLFFRKMAAFGLVLLALVGSGFVTVQYRTWLLTSDTFSVQRIDVEGQELLTQKELEASSGLSLNRRIWEADLANAEVQIRKNPWVESVTVERCFPGILCIRVTEKKPIALYNNRGVLLGIDRDGTVLPSRPGKLYTLPVISAGGIHEPILGRKLEGDGIHEGMEFLRTVLRDCPELYSRISELVADRNRGLVLYTSRGAIPVYVGQDGYSWKVRYLQAILEDVERRKPSLPVNHIDLRFFGQVVVAVRT